MRNKTSLALMELLVMILVFSLAAALCLKAFAAADSISRDTALRTRAAFAAQNAAEAFKGGTQEGVLLYTESGNPATNTAEAAFRAAIELLPSDRPGLEKAIIRVAAAEDGEPVLFTLETARGVAP